MATPPNDQGDEDDPPPPQPPRVLDITPPRLLEIGPTIERLREETRSWIARALVLLLVGTTVAMVALIGTETIKVNEALAMLGALTAVVGTALGFYFGGHKGG
jgi:hypothetical protein